MVVYEKDTFLTKIIYIVIEGYPFYKIKFLLEALADFYISSKILWRF